MSLRGEEVLRTSELSAVAILMKYSQKSRSLRRLETPLEFLPPRDDHTQKGYSQLLIVALLAAGIIAGTLLVQNGGSFMPKAAEQEPLHPSAGATKNCDNETNKEGCIAENNRICAADTVTYCDNRSGTPRAIRKSGGYYDPADPNTDPASGCVFDYREVSGKNSECGKTESKSGDVVYTTTDEAKKLDSERAEQSKSSSNSSSSGGAPNSQTTACTPAATNTYNDAKVANNLVRFYAIVNGAGNLCVPADLGVPVKDEITVDGVEGRLLMCSDKDAGLHWMIVGPGKLIPVPESQKTPPDRSTLEAGFKNLQSARCKAGLDTGDVCKGV